jgi:hypothetical protein
MALRDDVLAVLNALCEGTGVSEDADGDFRVLLGELPLWVRLFDDTQAVCVFCPLATEVPLSPDVAKFLREMCKSFVVFRVLWEDEEIILRADLAATPFVPGQLQRIVEDFEKVVAEIAPQAREWSRS